EEPRLPGVAADEGRRLAREGVGEVLRLVDVLAITLQRDAVLDAAAQARQIGVPAAGEPEPLREASQVRVEDRMGAEVPLADRAGDVTRGAQHLRDRHLVER